MRRALSVAVGALVLSGATAGATALGATGPLIASARLDGQFLLHGRVTKAVRIRGEHVGQTVQRTWTFGSSCPTGQCPQAGLVRQRAAGTDALTLNLISPGFYSGTGRFFAPLRCAGRTYAKGISVPFTIKVHITAATIVNGAAIATNVSASYTNAKRRNLTRCIAIPGHDAAKYTGSLVPSSGGVGP